MSTPGDLHKTQLEYWRTAVEEIREDTTHGSIYLSNKALDIIEEFIERQIYRNRTELLQTLSKLNNALVRAKPLMALIYNRAHHILEFIENIPREEKDIGNIKNATLEEIKRLRRKAEQNFKAITRFGSKLILDHHVILTHSASSQVEAILLEARSHKRRFQLICTESRPLREGAELARRMAQAGIKTRLIPDSDITRAVQDAHFILTGTDRITETSFINKTGTHAIAIVAKEMNKPFYIAGEADKILLKRTYPVRFKNSDPAELLDANIEHLQIQNIYFEEIPLSYLQKIVIEDGIFEMEEFSERYF